MNDEEAKQVIVVLGSGRSGTSLLMQILASLGMSTSGDMIPAKEQTPAGAYEDREIFQIQNEFVSEITPQAMPMPAEWQENAKLPQVMKQLQEIVTERIAKAATIWGFKDPKTAVLIPLWTRIFNSLNLVPKYILTVRNPQSVVASMQRQYNTKRNVAELFWLSRYAEALYNTGGNCFIIHYEDWFTEKAQVVALQLLEYSGLAKYFVHKNVNEALENAIQPNLVRSAYEDTEIKNRFVRELYTELKKCRGDKFNRQELMKAVGECRRAMDEFSGWANEAQRFLVSSQTRRKGDAKISSVAEKRLAELERELKSAVAEANACLRENTHLDDELVNLRMHLASDKKEFEDARKGIEAEKQKTINQNNQLKKENFSLRTSTSFRVGQVFVQAFAKPGKNTLLLPVYLARIILGQRVAR